MWGLESYSPLFNICGTAGVKFTGEELDTNIRLVLLSSMGRAAANVLENP